MRLIWYITGPKAGTYENFKRLPKSVSDMIAEGKAQEVTPGGPPLEFPENHPNYKPKTYDTKVLEAE